MKRISKGILPLLLVFLSMILLCGCVFSFQPLTMNNPTKGGFMMRSVSDSSMQSLAHEHTCLDSNELDVDDDTWEVYVSTMTEVMNSVKVLKKDKTQTMEGVKNFLISKTTLSSVPSPMQLDRKSLDQAMNEQENLFRKHYNFTQAQYNFAMRSLVYIGDTCAKRGIGLPVTVSWAKLKEGGMMPRENSISTYMYILSNEEDEKICSEALAEVATYHDILFAPNEKTIHLRVKSLIGKNNVEEAERVLASLPDKVDGGKSKRLRTFLPLLEHYCITGEPSSTLRLFRDMRQSPGVHFDADSYAMIIESLAKFGHFRLDAAPIEGASQDGFSSTHGPELFDEIASEMAEDILELTHKAAQRIRDGFGAGFGMSMPSGNEEIGSLSSEAIVADVAIGRVEIDAATGMCPGTGSKLRLLALNEKQRQHVHDTLLEMARQSYQEFSKTRKKSDEEDDDHGFTQLCLFSEWLDTREGEPFTAVVDGANVAYYGSPELHYSQVQLIVDELKSMGENPLVVLPKKYTNRNFQLSSTGYTQTLSERDCNVIERLNAQGNVYTVPPRCLDDYFWMLASVSNQTSARQNRILDVSTENTEGRFPGLRPMLVTNDQMRDHKLDLLEPREFRRWRSCHIVNYAVTPFVENEWEEHRSAELVPADFFSREIQGNRHGKKSGNVWHFPVSEWQDPSRLCIWIDR